MRERARFYEMAAACPCCSRMGNDPVLKPLNDLLSQQVAYGQLTVEEAAEDLQALIERLVAK